jgi:hypothetical protein
MNKPSAVQNRESINHEGREGHEPLDTRRHSSWRSLFFIRKESLRTTWTFRVLVTVLLVLLVAGTRGWWERAVADGLTCREDLGRSDALLLENFDPDYLVFERASALFRDGVARRAFVAVPKGRTDDPEAPNRISAGLAELMAQVAHLPSFQLIPVVEREPITLSVAQQLREPLMREGVRSVTVVSPGFRSRRSVMIYATAFAPGITVRCVPVFGLNAPTNWTRRWHGIQEVGLQFLKMQYYRFWVLA